MSKKQKHWADRFQSNLDGPPRLTLGGGMWEINSPGRVEFWKMCVYRNESDETLRELGLPWQQKWRM